MPFKLIKANRGIDIDLDAIPLDDKEACELLTKGDTSGVFQLESDGITKLVMDLKPEHFEDLIPLVALYRPGPLGVWAWWRILSTAVMVKKR